MFILAACLHCFVYISHDVVTRGYIHLVFISFGEYGTTGGTSGFGDAVMYDGALILFKYEDDFGCCR